MTLARFAARLLRGGFISMTLAALMAVASNERVGAQLSATYGMGAMFPTGEIGDYVVPGPTFDGRLMYDLSSRVGVGIQLGYDSHEGADTPYTIYTGPPFQTLRYGLAANLALLPPESGSFSVSIGGGVGLATILSDRLYDPSKPPIGVTVGGPGQTEHSADPLQFKGTYPSFTGSLRFGYTATQVTTLFVEGVYLFSPMDDTHTQVFVQGPFPVAEIAADGFSVQFREDTTPLKAPTSLSSYGVRIGLRRAF